MKVVLYMAQTINGKIARENYEEEFFTDESWDEFVRFAEKTGCFVIGRKTYEIYKRKNSKRYTFDNIKAKVVVVSRNAKLKLGGNYIPATSPKEAVKKLSRLGFKEIMVTGGGMVNSGFMGSNMIDEIIINVEPYVLGNGIGIFSEGAFENGLKFLSIKKLGLGVIQLRYRVTGH